MAHHDGADLSRRFACPYRPADLEHDGRWEILVHDNEGGPPRWVLLTPASPLPPCPDPRTRVMARRSL